MYVKSYIRLINLHDVYQNFCRVATNKYIALYTVLHSQHSEQQFYKLQRKVKNLSIGHKIYSKRDVWGSM